MRLLSATIRHYRVHHELRVQFHESRTLIGGPNESGKSTLIEAIHRALFLKSKVTGDVQKSMVSTTSPGTPEVDVVFEAGGKIYQLGKRFSGNNGTTRLVETGGVTLLGDEAESRLAALLGVEAIGGGRGVGDRVSQQWSHLWVWQGQSGNDPTEYASAQQTSLLQRLQQSGAATAMQSSLDAAVATHFAEAVESTFARGRAKAGSELGRAEVAAAEAEEKLGGARERLARLRQAVDDYNDASNTLTRVGNDSRSLIAQLKTVDEKQAKVDELRRQELLQVSAAESAAEKLAGFERAHQQVAKVRASIAESDVELAPKNAEVNRLAEAHSEIRQRAELAARDYESACEATRAQRLRHDLAAAWLTQFEKDVRLDELSRKAQQVQKLESTLSEMRQDLAKLPELDAAKLKKLQKLEAEVGSAEASLQAIAAGLDIVASDQPVLVGGQPLAAGETRVLVDDTEITIGRGIRLRVRPGGGTSLAEARQNAHDARHSLQKSLGSVGIASVADASEVVGRRNELATRISATESTLEGLDASDIVAALADARAASAAAGGDVSRRWEQVPGAVPPTSAPEAKTMVEAEAQRLNDAETGERRAKLARDAEAQAFNESEAALKRARLDVEKQTRAIGEFRAQLRLLIETNGDDDVRNIRLTEARSASNAATQFLATTRVALAELQPDLLAADRERLERAKIQTESTRGDAEAKRAVAQAALRSDGTDDPEAALALALSHAESAREHLSAVRQKAKAIQLLHQLFLEEQRALSERFTRPLADKISEYLQCLFGTGTRANVALVENSFSGFQLVRPMHGGGAQQFDTLSGGAREQVAAAMRLAMAEVLAADHDDCLPVVFDDAFAYSDPDRVQTLQRMLDVAAARGLQVIVLTCTPSDYTALGAQTISLRVSRSPVAHLARPSPEGADETETEVEDAPAQPPMAVTDDQRQMLLTALREAGGKAGNIALRETLGWNEETYEAVREILVAAGEITPGRGRGGSVLLPGLAS
jgi:DNA repair exonuclease SbcCD ATPase subunit